MTEATKKASLDEVMSAMDVVDVLRHQQVLVARELDSDGREQQLLERLRKIYKSQGLDVPDHVLKDGIKALEEQRFQYKPHDNSKLAHLYVNRGSWGKPLGSILLILCFAAFAYYHSQIRPLAKQRNALPTEIFSTYQAIESVATDPAVIADAYSTREVAEAALASKDYDQASTLNEELKTTLNLLQQEFELRVVSRPGESSGVWRIAEVNSTNRNYYLIVEAINSKNQVVSLPILNEENNQLKTVKTWGLRVDENTFNQVASDKRDDGIIQNNIVGTKARGAKDIRFLINTTGKAITSW